MKFNLSHMIPVLRTSFALFSAVGVGFLMCGCPGSVENKTATFSFVATPVASPTAGSFTSVPDTHSWQTAIVIDPAAVVSPSADPITAPSPYDISDSTNGIGNTGNTHISSSLEYYPPLSGVFDSAGRPYVGMISYDNNAIDSSGLTDARVQAVVTAPQNYSTDTWSSTTDYSMFTTLGSGIAYDSGISDRRGTFSIDFHGDTLANTFSFIGRLYDDSTAHLYVARKASTPSGTSDSWIDGTVPEKLSTTSLPLYADLIQDQRCPVRTASDGAGSVIALWCGNRATTTYTYFLSFYHQGVGWSAPLHLGAAGTYSFLGSTYYPSDGTNVNFTTTIHPILVGGDLGLDSNGDGWVVVPMKTDPLGANHKSILVAYRYYKSSGLSTAPVVLDSLGVQTIDSKYNALGAPRLWVKSDGSASVFYYKTKGCTVGGLSCVTGLMRIDRSVAGVWSSPVQVDDTTISTISIRTGHTGASTKVQAQYPGLAFNGDWATVVYVKQATTGGNYRLYSSIYNPTTSSWGTPAAIDGASNYGVGWYSVAAGLDATSSGKVQFIYAYEGLASASAPDGVPTSVRVRTYSVRNSGYTPETNLGSSLTLTDGRPTAIASQDGKTAVLFMGVASSLRRAYLSSYR